MNFSQRKCDSRIFIRGNMLFKEVVLSGCVRNLVVAGTSKDIVKKLIKEVFGFFGEGKGYFFVVS